MDQARREFLNVVRSDAVDEAMPVDAYLAVAAKPFSTRL